MFCLPYTISHFQHVVLTRTKIILYGCSFIIKREFTSLFAIDNISKVNYDTLVKNGQCLCTSVNRHENISGEEQMWFAYLFLNFWLV